MTSVLTSSQDWTEFVDFYGKAVKNGTLFEQTGSLPSQVPSRRMELICRGPIRYTARLRCSRRSTRFARRWRVAPRPTR
jgi:hypothetical protein